MQNTHNSSNFRFSVCFKRIQISFYHNIYYIHYIYDSIDRNFDINPKATVTADYLLFISTLPNIECGTENCVHQPNSNILSEIYSNNKCRRRFTGQEVRVPQKWYECERFLFK